MRVALNALVRSNADPTGGVRRHRGIGMPEFLVALVLFSIGLLGLVSTQLTGIRATRDASQRNLALLLARDMLERIRANPSQLSVYSVLGLGDGAAPVARPEVDCRQVPCEPEELAAFDLWQWQSLLTGAGTGSGLASPVACIRHDGGTLILSLSWAGHLSLAGNASPRCDASPGEGSPGMGPERRRHRVHLRTYLRSI